MITFETRAQYLAACTDRTANSYRPPSAPYLWRCATCGKACTHDDRYGISADDGMHCYRCCHAHDVAQMLDRTKPFSCYVSGDKKTVSNWPGDKLGDIVSYGEARTGFYGSVQAYFRVRDVHGGLWAGRGPGAGMYCTLRAIKGA